MDYSRNKKYFEQKQKTWPVILAFSLIAVGLICVILLANTRGISRGLMTPLGLVCIFIGTVIWVVRMSIRIKDSEITECAHKARDDFKTDFMNHFTETDAAKLKFAQTYGSRRENDDNEEPEYFGTYVFEGDGIMTKKGSDGKNRSSVYAVSGCLLRRKTICLGERSTNLIGPEKPCEDRFIETSYESLGDCRLIDPSESGYTGRTKYRHILVTDSEGRTVIEFPVLDDAEADEYAESIAVRIKRAHEAAKKAEKQ